MPKPVYVEEGSVSWIPEWCMCGHMDTEHEPGEDRFLECLECRCPGFRLPRGAHVPEGFDCPGSKVGRTRRRVSGDQPSDRPA